MNEHLYLKFADHAAAIRALRTKDQAFSELCTDYEEICTWLASHERAAEIASEEIDHARELRRELEEDINRRLAESQAT